MRSRIQLRGLWRPTSLFIVSRGVHKTHSPAQSVGPARTWTDHSDGRRWVATHRTRSLRVSRRVSSPKTRATRPDHKSNKIRRDWKLFRQRATWNPPNLAIFFIFRRRSTWNPLDSARSDEISSRSTPDLIDPAKYRPDQDRSGKISAPAAKYRNRRQNLKPNQHQPETRQTRTGWSDN